MGKTSIDDCTLIHKYLFVLKTDNLIDLSDLNFMDLRVLFEYLESEIERSIYGYSIDRYILDARPYRDLSTFSSKLKSFEIEYGSGKYPNQVDTVRGYDYIRRKLDNGLILIKSTDGIKILEDENGTLYVLNSLFNKFKEDIEYPRLGELLSDLNAFQMVKK